MVAVLARVRDQRQHDAGTGEASDIVHVAAGLVVLQALTQPDDLAHAEVMRQPFLDLLAVEVGIAAGAQQALLGGQQRALAVDVDGAALEHHGRLVAPHAEALEQRRAERRVMLVGSAGAAPGGDAPVRPRDPARAVDEEAGGAVADPGIVDLEGLLLDPAAADERGVGDVLGPRHQGHGLELGDDRGHPGVGLPGIVEALAPGLGAARPSHPAACVGLPFGRHV